MSLFKLIWTVTGPKGGNGNKRVLRPKPDVEID